MVSVYSGESQWVLTRGSIGNADSITTNGNVSVASWVITLVTVPFLDFVMIH